jgi:2,3-bisphosphoglycerate-dependent phosphoglycerate mutase
MSNPHPHGTLILVRHGQSVANLTTTYAGWLDSDLTTRGIEEARRCGQFLKTHGICIDCCFASYLRRSIRTLLTILDVTDQMWVPTFKTWCLNECHCGQFTGLTPSQITERFGSATFTRWRTVYNNPPPLLAPDDPRSPLLDPRYRTVDPRVLPMGESLQMAWQRLEGYWNQTIMPEVYAGKVVLVVCHGNIIRAIRRALEGLSERDIMEKGVVANGFPLVYRFDGKRMVTRVTLGDRAVRKTCKAQSQII